MKQILEISNISYDAAESKTTFSLTNYYLHEDGQKEVKTQETREVPGQASNDGIEAYVKTLIAVGYNMEVVIADTTTSITEGIQNGQTTGTVGNDEAEAQAAQAAAEAEGAAQAEAQAKAEAEAEAQAEAEAEAQAAAEAGQQG
jgi:hypothetical protein